MQVFFAPSTRKLSGCSPVCCAAPEGGGGVAVMVWQLCVMAALENTELSMVFDGLQQCKARKPLIFKDLLVGGPHS